MGNCAVVIPLKDRFQELSEKIEEKLSLKIREASRRMAAGILSQPELNNITKVIHKEVLLLGTDVAKTALNDIALLEAEPKNVKSMGLRSRTLATILGDVSYERKAFYDKNKHALVFPADESLRINGGQLQSDLLSKMVQVGIEVPFAEAAELCESLMGVKVSEGSIHGAVVKAGSRASYEDVVPSKEDIHHKLDHLKITNPGEPVHLVIGVDGAMEPLRPEGSKRKGKRGESFWKECKGFRLFAIVGKETIQHLTSWHQIGNDEDLGQYLKLLAKSIEDRPEPLVIAADGAKWIWNQVEKAFKSRIEVLDWYHAVEHLSNFADLHFSKDKEKKYTWLEHSKSRLMDDDVEGIIHGLKRMTYSNEKEREASRTLQTYLESNKHRMNYGTLQKQGLTIGSGGMESANKCVSHIRLKRNGCWWKTSHANEILRLRCAKANGTLKAFLAQCWDVRDSLANTQGPGTE
jgi:hypothetical protein